MNGDLLGLLLVYLYVGFLLLVSEKILKSHPHISRKFLHIMVGNIFLILPMFETMWVMALLAAAPFVVLTFLMSPHSPVKLVSETTSAGHGLGLVYYSIAWAVLALLFFDTPEVIAVGIVAMSYGDGTASLVGSKWGKRKYNTWGEKKSLEGSIAMFLATIAMLFIVLEYYNAAPILAVILVVCIAATILEAITPKGLDNLAVSLGSAFLFFSLVNIF